MEAETMEMGAVVGYLRAMGLEVLPEDCMDIAAHLGPYTVEVSWNGVILVIGRLGDVACAFANV